MPSYPTQQFNPYSIPSVQGMLISLAEFVSGTITTTNISTQESVLEAIQQTLLNAIDLINAAQIQSLMAQEYSLLSRINSASLGLSVQDQTFINARLASFNNLVNTIYPLPTNLTLNLNLLNTGAAALPSYDLLLYMANFNAEVPPLGLSTANFNVQAQAAAQAWADALAFLTSNGTSFQLTSYNSVERMYDCSQDCANFDENLTFASNINAPYMQQMWNSLLALPSLLRVAQLLYDDPSSVSSQLWNTIKYVILNLVLETNAIIATFTVPNNLQQPQTATLRVGETLMDFAARTTGSFENWQAVATSNNLMPPYVGTMAAPGIAIPGQKLYLPPFTAGSAISSYADAYLGTDIDIGIPYSTMTVWSGDFTLIKGLNNYLGALARRVLTPIGSLIYHTDYGSLLPSEVGAISTSSEAILLSSFLKSSLLSDPRTQAVNQITAYPVTFGQIVLTALVTPYGSAAAIPFNLVLIPQNTAITKQ